MEKRIVHLRRIAPVSLGKVLGLLYALLGIIVGALFSCFSLVGSAAMAEFTGDALTSFIFGVGSVIIWPLLYGVMGFIGGIITAVLYNLIASWIGGLELELE